MTTDLVARNRAITQLSELGWSTLELAAAFRVSRPTIIRVLVSERRVGV